MTQRIGVCSWSLRPQSVDELISRVSACGLKCVQLALDPIRAGEWDEQQTIHRLRDATFHIASGMMAMKGEDYSTLDSIRQSGGVRSDEHWEANLAAAHENAALSQRLGLPLTTLHAGFLPHDADDPLRTLMIERLRAIIDAFEAHNVRTAFETGQESAETLLGVLDELDRPTVGVNFDPANMILYAMGDPVASLKALAPHVLQVHIKDADPTDTPGTWGTERPAGTGSVDWPAFFNALTSTGLNCDLMIEREAGADRGPDIVLARTLVKQHLGAGVDA